MAEEATPTFQIQRIYLKESSLEQPNSPAILLEQTQPTVDIQLGVEANNAADGVYEICVTATVHTKIEERTVFLVEVKQAGIFEIRNIEQEQMSQIMGSGFPPVHLSEINFQAMYEQQRAQQAQAGAGAAVTQ